MLLALALNGSCTEFTCFCLCFTCDTIVQVSTTRLAALLCNYLRNGCTKHTFYNNRNVTSLDVFSLEKVLSTLTLQPDALSCIASVAWYLYFLFISPHVDAIPTPLSYSDWCEFHSLSCGTYKITPLLHRFNLQEFARSYGNDKNMHLWKYVDNSNNFSKRFLFVKNNEKNKEIRKSSS